MSRWLSSSPSCLFLQCHSEKQNKNVYFVHTEGILGYVCKYGGLIPLAAACGEQWSHGRAPDCQSRGRGFNPPAAISKHLPVSFSRDTKSRWSLLLQHFPSTLFVRVFREYGSFNFTDSLMISKRQFSWLKQTVILFLPPARCHNCVIEITFSMIL